MARENVSVADNFICWKSALEEAKRQRAEAEARVRCLRNSIRIIENKIANGEVWPGTQSVNQGSRHQDRV
jgi:hypothetical protein